MPTINDVAKLAGVSVGTVSNVINNLGNVSIATRQKVERAIAELGYVPSATARSLRSKRTRWLTMVVPTVAHPHWQALVRGAEDEAYSRGYVVLLGNTDEDLAKQDQYLDVAIGQNVAGIIIAPCNPDPDDLARLRRRNIPVVLINRRVNGRQVDGVFCDNTAAARTLVRHLIELGHRRIAMVSGPKRLSTMQERMTGYIIALAEAGLTPDHRLLKFHERPAPADDPAVDQLLAGANRPTAIFAATSEIARDIIVALGRRGLRVPQDMALVCFGDHTQAIFPFLTYILEPGYEMGVEAARLLFSRLEAGPSLEPRQIFLPTQLIVRYSCGSKLSDAAPGPSLLLTQERSLQSKRVEALDPAIRRQFSDQAARMIGLAMKNKTSGGAIIEKN